VRVVNAQQWKVWNTSNSNIPTNGLSSLYLDSDGIIWIGSGNAGLIKFNGVNFTSYNTSNSPMKSNLVQYMAIDKFENLWLCAFQSGAGNEGALMKFDRASNWSFYNSQNSGIAHGNQFSVTVDTNNVVWCFYNRLSRFDGTTWKIYDSTNSPLKASIAPEMYTDKYNNKWMGLNFYGLYKLEQDSIWTIYNPGNSGIGGAFITRIREDGIGNYWINISSSGLCRYTPSNNSWQNWTPQNSNLISAYPWGLYIDKNSTKWVGFNNTETGLSEFTDIQFLYYSPPTIGNGTSIKDIKQDKLGNLWLATGDGLIEFNKNGIVGINNQNTIIPQDFKIERIYPNPFNPTASIEFSINRLSNIKIKVSDLSGKEIETLANTNYPHGKYQVTWNAAGFPSGIYFVSLYVNNNFFDAKKLSLVK